MKYGEAMAAAMAARRHGPGRHARHRRRPAIVPHRAARRGRRPHRPRVRRPRRAARRRAAHRLRPLPVRRRRHRAPGDLRRRPRPGPRHARRALRRGRHGHRREPPRWATTAASPSARRELDGRRAWRRALPGPRVHLAAAAGGGGRGRSSGCEPVGDPGRIHAEGLAARVGGRDGAGAGGRAARRPPALGRVHQRRHRGDRRRRAGGPPSAAATRCSPPSSTRPCASPPRPTARSPSSASTATAASIPPSSLAAVRDDTALVHVQWGNHEVGTRQPVAEVVAACRERGVLVHVDAAPGRRPRARSPSTTSAPTCSRCRAHKLGGPPGVGALLVRRGLRIRPLLVGGDQERARRAGLEPVAAIAGFGAAAERSPTARSRRRPTAQRRAHRPRARRASPSLDGVHVYGDPDDRLPHLVCLGIDGIEPQAVLLGLDRAGVAAHSGSAPARPRRSSRRPCSRRWASTPTAACACPSAGAPPTPTSTAALDALPEILAALRRLR